MSNKPLLHNQQKEVRSHCACTWSCCSYVSTTPGLNIVLRGFDKIQSPKWLNAYLPKWESLGNLTKGGGLSGLQFQKGAFWKIWTKIYCSAINLLVHHSSLSHTTYVETNQTSIPHLYSDMINDTRNRPIGLNIDIFFFTRFRNRCGYLTVPVIKLSNERTNFIFNEPSRILWIAKLSSIFIIFV